MTGLSLFDVLGPIMIGPSSSHTAGAVRIGWLARNIAGDMPTAIRLGFHDSLMQTYKGHATDSGLVAGLLGYREDDERVRTSLDEAERLGIRVSVEQLKRNGDPGEMECEVQLRDESTRRVSGISVGGGVVVISEIDGIPVSLDGVTGGLLIRHGSSALPAALLQVLQSHGLWADAARTWHTGVRSISFVPGPSVPGPSDPGSEFSSQVETQWGTEGILECAWIDGLQKVTIPPSSRRTLFSSGDELIRLAAGSGHTLHELAVQYETALTGRPPEAVRAHALHILEVMRATAKRGLEEPLRLFGGFASGEDAKRVWKRAGQSLGGPTLSRAMARALAVAEVNAAKGKVVASPTAGSCGVVPGVILTAGETATDEALVDALLVSATAGAIIGRTASFSGDVGGCQAEIGIASAMAAAGAAHIGGGSVDEVLHAAALALKNMLGLACDPAAGPVEVPCIKRNAGGAAIALCAADLALSGVKSVIPFDEVVLAAKNVQDLMHEDLRDNTRGGLGSTPTAARMKAEWACRCKGVCK